MTIVRYILFINVGIVILLHTLIPHEHHQKMTYIDDLVAHKKACNVFEIIGLAFHEGPSSCLDEITIRSSKYFIRFEKNNPKIIRFSNEYKYKIKAALKTKHSINSQTSQTYGKYSDSNRLRGPPKFDT
jgi:hypothetical protein